MQTLTAISQGVVLGGGQMNCSSPFTPVNPLGQRPTFSCFRGRAFDCCGKRENFSAFLRGHARSFNGWFLWIAGDVRSRNVLPTVIDDCSVVTSSVATVTPTVAEP